MINPMPPNESVMSRVDYEPDLGVAERYLRDFIRAANKSRRRPSPVDFSHIPNAEARRDMEEAVAIRKGYQYRGTERGTLLEQLLQLQIELSNWFGDDAFAFVTTDFDDLKNGIDAVIEWGPERAGGLVPRFAVDFTTSSSQDGLQKKLQKIREWSRVKYFRSEVETDEGGEPTDLSLHRLPTVILGLDTALFESFAKMVHEAGTVPVPNPAFDETMPQGESNRKFVSPAVQIRKVLANNPFRILLLLQARGQLLAQRNNPLAELCYNRVQMELEKIKDSPEYRRALVIGKSSATHRGLTLSP